MRKGKNDKIWKDFHLRRIVEALIILIFFSYLIIELIFYLDTSSPRVYLYILLLFFLLGVINLFRQKLTYLATDGIRIGNASKDSYDFIKLKYKAEFILWEEIKSITIKGRSIRKPFHIIFVDFLIIKTKDNKKHESYIAKPKEFINTLKILKKESLLSKNSKYLDLITTK